MDKTHANENEKVGTSRVMGVLHARSSKKDNFGGLSIVNVIIGRFLYEGLYTLFSMQVF
jgi:hypothetical protein